MKTPCIPSHSTQHPTRNTNRVDGYGIPERQMHTFRRWRSKSVHAPAKDLYATPVENYLLLVSQCGVWRHCDEELLHTIAFYHTSAIAGPDREVLTPGQEGKRACGADRSRVPVRRTLGRGGLLLNSDRSLGACMTLRTMGLKF
jgi:hypothetical protein